MADTETLQARLNEAEHAQHQLSIGAMEVTIEYDGSRVQYTRANRSDLNQYIRSLKRQLGQPVSRRSRSVRF